MIYKVKRKYYKSILGGQTPDVIAILGGGDSINHVIKKRTLRGLITLLYKGRNPHLISGMEARIIALLELCNYFQDAKVVPMSHKSEKSFSERDTLSYAEKMGMRLMIKGISSERIIYSERSTSTVTELMDLVKLAIMNKWKTIAVVTNAYHMERSKLLFYLLTNHQKRTFFYKSCYHALKTAEDQELFKKEWENFLHAYTIFESQNAQALFISAEEILPEKYVFYEKVIDAVEISEAYLNREKLEEKGVQMLLNGTYNFDQNHTLESYLHYKENII